MGYEIKYNRRLFFIEKFFEDKKFAWNEFDKQIENKKCSRTLEYDNLAKQLGEIGSVGYW